MHCATLQVNGKIFYIDADHCRYKQRSHLKALEGVVTCHVRLVLELLARYRTTLFNTRRNASADLSLPETHGRLLPGASTAPHAIYFAFAAVQLPL